MKIAIMGFAGQGQSSYEYWNKKGNEVVICDQSPEIEIPKGVTARLGRDYLRNLDEFDLLVRTPALHPRHIVAENSPEILDKVTSNTNEFFKVCPTKKIIGVTGTKGKGTTSTLIAKILEKAGHTVHLGGNIGTPPLDMLKDIKKDDWVVLELANFQLIDLKTSPKIGVCLMVEPEHMDWHTDYNEYLDAKSQLFINQAKTDKAIYYAKNDDSLSIAAAGDAEQIPYMEVPGAVVEKGIIKIDDAEIIPVAELKLLGEHNWQNVCAALTAAWQITQDTKAIKQALTSFTGLEHRLELVKEHKGVKYYDDSFGTTPSTATVAIRAFSQPKVLILGGSDKGAEYIELAKAVKSSNVKKVVLIGDTGPEIQRALDNEGFTDYIHGASNMPDIVKEASALAKKGDVVLLSTACASFDMFKNYKDRGEQFKKAVKALS